MQKWFFLLCFIIHIAAAQTVVKDCIIGETTVRLQQETFSWQQKGIYFLNLHSNETTSIEAAEEYLANQSGSLLQLMHDEGRYISFKLGEGDYKIDPNRIFTLHGRMETLKKNATYTLAAEKETAKLADSILSFLANPTLMIAMHNNTDGDFSIKSYGKGKTESINAAAVYINPLMDMDDFVYTTELRIYRYLKLKKINVVLQKTKGFKDDGSLGVYCGFKHIPYINVEAQEGHKEEQLQMLYALTEIVAYYEWK